MKKIDKSRIKTWFVTGASSGVGYEACSQLLAKGYNVVAVSRRLAHFEHPNVFCISADVSNMEAVDSAVRKGIERFGRVDVLFNNAGISSYGTIEEESLSEMHAVMDTNFWGTFNTMRLLIPHFRENNNGTIINNSSECGICARSFGAAYVSSKFAVEGLTSSARLECQNFCRVMAVELSFFARTYIGAGKHFETGFEEYKDIPLLPIPLPKCKYPNDITKAVSFIIEEAEKEVMQEHLMLRQDIKPKIQYQISTLSKCLKQSARRADCCFGVNKRESKIGLNSQDVSKNIGLMNFHWENVNFGALITSYALNQYLNDKGYYARNIDYIPSFPWIDKEEPNPLFDNFRKKHLPVTRRFNAGQSLSMLNDEFSTFIVGSDQVWRHEFIKNEKEAYFLSFANCEKKLISYAASFGVDTINATETEIDEYKMLMSLFDAISVREDSGIKICEEMGVRATKMCDPVFLLSQQKWCDLAEEGKVEGCEDDVVFYTINEELEEDILKFINDNKDVLKYKSVKNITWKTSVEEWLFRVKNCKFFVTDSFHGSCFAIIFNKPFVCVNTNTRTSTRMLSLFDMLGIKGRYFSAFDDVNMHNLLAKETNYQKVNKFLEEMRKKSEEFLIAAIESPIDNIEEKKAIKKRYDEYVYQNALKSKNKIYFRYLKYKLLSRFPFGKKRNKYKQKRKEWRIYYKQNKLILKSKGK